MQEISKQTDDTQGTIAVMRIVYHFTAGPAPPLSPFNFSDHALDDVRPHSSPPHPLAAALTAARDARRSSTTPPRTSSR